MSDDEHGNSPLHIAAITNNPEDVVSLLRSGAKGSLENYDEMTAAELAILSKSYDALKALCDNGGLGVPEDGHGLSPLHTAAHTDNLRAIAMLVDAGLSVNHRSGSGHTPIHLWASGGTNIDTGRLLDKYGADWNAVAPFGDDHPDTPLDCAEDDDVKDFIRSKGGRGYLYLRAV